MRSFVRSFRPEVPTTDQITHPPPPPPFTPPNIPPKTSSGSRAVIVPQVRGTEVPVQAAKTAPLERLVL